MNERRRKLADESNQVTGEVTERGVGNPEEGMRGKEGNTKEMAFIERQKVLAAFSTNRFQLLYRCSNHYFCVMRQ